MCCVRARANPLKQRRGPRPPCVCRRPFPPEAKHYMCVCLCVVPVSVKSPPMCILFCPPPNLFFLFVQSLLSQTQIRGARSDQCVGLSLLSFPLPIVSPPPPPSRLWTGHALFLLARVSFSAALARWLMMCCAPLLAILAPGVCRPRQERRAHAPPSYLVGGGRGVWLFLDCVVFFFSLV